MPTNEEIESAGSDGECIHAQQCNCNSEKVTAEIAKKRAEQEGYLMLIVGMGISLTPFAIIWINYLSAKNHYAAPVDPQIITYCLVSSGAVVAYFFGKGIITDFPKKK